MTPWIGMHYIPAFKGFYRHQGDAEGYLAALVDGVIFSEPRTTERLSRLEREQVPIETFRPSKVDTGIRAGNMGMGANWVSYFYDPRKDLFIYALEGGYVLIPLRDYRKAFEENGRSMAWLRDRLNKDMDTFVMLEDHKPEDLAKLDEVFQDAIPE